MKLAIEQANDPEFWRTLCPELSVGSPAGPPPYELSSPADALEQFRHEGYLHLPDVVPPATTQALVAGAERLHAKGIHPLFVFVYDETWSVFHSLRQPLSSLLGLDLEPKTAFWSWYVPTSDESTGWSPHRDNVRRTSDHNGTLRSVSVWVALSDATPRNGCIYAVPAHLDPRFRDDAWEEPDDDRVNLQDVRALPANAGSILVWHQGLRHWGGRSSSRALTARCSASLEFQRVGTAPSDPAFGTTGLAPATSTRLRLIGQQLLQYRHMQALDSETKLLAAALNGRRP